MTTDQSGNHSTKAKMKTKEASARVTVLGAGYSGLTTAAELTLRGFKVDVVAADLGYRPPLTIVGTQVCMFQIRKQGLDWRYNGTRI